VQKNQSSPTGLRKNSMVPRFFAVPPGLKRIGVIRHVNPASVLGKPISSGEESRFLNRKRTREIQCRRFLLECGGLVYPELRRTAAFTV
jgi:hypothetical protein